MNFGGAKSESSGLVGNCEAALAAGKKGFEVALPNEAAASGARAGELSGLDPAPDGVHGSPGQRGHLVEQQVGAVRHRGASCLKVPWFD